MEFSNEIHVIVYLYKYKYKHDYINMDININIHQIYHDSDTKLSLNRHLKNYNLKMLYVVSDCNFFSIHCSVKPHSFRQ